MLIIDAVNSSFQTIFSHKFRSFLTLLGIIIGITSVVAMFSSINGMKTLIAENMEGMGWNNQLVVKSNTGMPQRRGRGFWMMASRTTARKSKPLTYRDYEALKSEVETKYIFGLVEVWSRTVDNKWFRVRATNNDYFEVNTFPLQRGRYFNSFEEKSGAKVAIVGPFFSDEHFNGNDPLDEYYTAGNTRYRIIGVLDEDPLNKSGTMQMNPWGRRWDLQAFYIPLRTGCIYYRQNMALDTITLYSIDTDGFAQMQSRTNQVLLAHRNMQKDFEFENVAAQMLQITKQLEEMMSNWSITLLAIASVSLLVGGIGLFSTLLISITERLTEIGIRKSIGARDIDIFLYFIMEALTLSFIAAIVGIVFGFLITKGLGVAIKMSIPISMLSVYVGFGFALVIGFLSGLYPAIKASRINPIEAIYYNE